MQKDLDESKLLYVSTPTEWHDWLLKHHSSEKKIWLVYFKKHSGKPRIKYNDAVEEALCFGWIDSTVRSIDKDRFAQRFSIRNPKSPYSQANKERLRHLMAQGRIMKEVIPALKGILDEPFTIPADILEAIRINPEAWKNFQGFSQSYIRIRTAFINAARKRPEEFNKRLKYFIKMTEKNKLFGFGGIEKYF